jgi:hypothetical protein
MWMPPKHVQHCAVFHLIHVIVRVSPLPSLCEKVRASCWLETGILKLTGGVWISRVEQGKIVLMLAASTKIVTNFEIKSDINVTSQMVVDA